MYNLIICKLVIYGVTNVLPLDNSNVIYCGGIFNILISRNGRDIKESISQGMEVLL
jgi:hypothetical protein